MSITKLLFKNVLLDDPSLSSSQEMVPNVRVEVFEFQVTLQVEFRPQTNVSTKMWVVLTDRGESEIAFELVEHAFERFRCDPQRSLLLSVVTQMSNWKRGHAINFWPRVLQIPLEIYSFWIWLIWVRLLCTWVMST